MAQTRGTWSELYDNVEKMVMGVMFQQLKELPPIYREYYNVKTSSKKFQPLIIQLKSSRSGINYGKKTAYLNPTRKPKKLLLSLSLRQILRAPCIWDTP